MSGRKRASGPVALRYAGSVPVDGSALALPEGWPAADHVEADAAVAAMKLACGQYEAVRVEVVSDGDGTAVV